MKNVLLVLVCVVTTLIFIGEEPAYSQKSPEGGISKPSTRFKSQQHLPASQLQQSYQPSLDPLAQKELTWVLTGKGEKPAIARKQAQEIKMGVYNPQFIGNPLTEINYFKNWFTPYDVDPPEHQMKVFREIQKMKKETEIEPFSVTSSTQWTQKGPIGMTVLGSSPTVYFSGRVTSIDYNSTAGLHLTEPILKERESGSHDPDLSGCSPLSHTQ